MTGHLCCTYADVQMSESPLLLLTLISLARGGCNCEAATVGMMRSDATGDLICGCCTHEIHVRVAGQRWLHLTQAAKEFIMRCHHTGGLICGCCTYETDVRLAGQRRPDLTQAARAVAQQRIP